MSSKTVTQKPVKMVLRGKGRVMNRPSKVGGKSYDRYMIYIPTTVARDSAFPFTAGEEISIRIEEGRLIVEKAQT